MLATFFCQSFTNVFAFFDVYYKSYLNVCRIYGTVLLVLQVNVEVVQRPVIFPSVTICNKNHLDILVVDRLVSMFDGSGDGDVASKATGDVQKFIRKYSEFSDKTTAFLKHAENLSVMQYNYEIPEVRSETSCRSVTNERVNCRCWCYCSEARRPLDRWRRFPPFADSARTAAAAGLSPLLVRPPGTVSRTLSATQTPPKLLSGAC